MLPSGNGYALTLLLSGHQCLGGGLHKTAWTLVWVLLLLEDLQGTSDFRFLWGAISTLCLGQGLGTQCICSVLHIQHLLRSYHTEETSTHVCLSPVKTDAAQAAVLARLSQEDGGLSGFGPGSALEGLVCLGLRGETFSDLPLLAGMALFPFLCEVGLRESLWPPCWSSFRPQVGPESRPVSHPTRLRERGSPPPSTM